jgi:hypothetical protein
VHRLRALPGAPGGRAGEGQHPTVDRGAAPACEDDWDDDEVDPDFVEDLLIDVALSHHAESPDGTQVLPDLLLDLTTMTARLNVLMAEAEEEEWKAAWPRLHAFLEQVGKLPTGPRARRPVGFRVREKERKTSKRKKGSHRGD